MDRQFYFLVASTVFLILVCIPIVVSVDDLMALQGNVKQGDTNLASGNLTVYIFDAYSLGNLVYNSSGDFNNSILNGKYDVMLGNGTNELHLEYGKFYYMEMFVNNEKFSFNGAPRQVFQSSTGMINASAVSPGQINATHLTANLALNGNVTVSGNLTVVGNFSAQTGFFSYLGDVINKITKAWFTNVEVSGTLNVSNLNVTNNLSVGGVLVNPWLYNQTGNYGYNMTDGSYNLTYANYAYNQTAPALTIVATNVTALNASITNWLYNQSGIYYYNQTLPLMNWAYNQTPTDYLKNDSNANFTTLNVTNRFAVNGSAFYVGSNGNVGIGTSIPKGLFEINAATTYGLNISNIMDSGTIYGINSYTSSGANTYGGKFVSNNIDGGGIYTSYGILTNATGTSGTAYGIYSTSRASAGTYGGYFDAASSSVTGNAYGLLTRASTGSNAQAYGISANATGGSPSYGVYGGATGGSNTVYGVYGTANTNANGIAYGLYGIATASSGSATNYGIYASASGSEATNWAGLFEGAVNISGSLFVAGVNISDNLDVSKFLKNDSNANFSNLNVSGKLAVGRSQVYSDANGDMIFRLT